MKRKIVYVETPFHFKWYKLDFADVISVCEFIRNNYGILPDTVKQSFLNLYNDLQKPKNPRNIKFYETNKFKC